MKLRRMKKYTMIYEVEVRAKRIKGRKEFLDRYYESKRFPLCQVLSKAKRK